MLRGAPASSRSCSGKKPLGLIYLDRHTAYARDRELLEIFASQAAAAIQNSLLYDMATTDSLTGVYVRGFAVQQLQQAIKRSIRRGDPLSLLMIDLDKFKQINDTYGHQVGDRALARRGRAAPRGRSARRTWSAATAATSSWWSSPTPRPPAR